MEGVVSQILWYIEYLSICTWLLIILAFPSTHQDVRRGRPADGAQEVDRLLRGRAGCAVCGVAERLRHDHGGGAHHGADPLPHRVTARASRTSSFSPLSFSLSLLHRIVFRRAWDSSRPSATTFSSAARPWWVRNDGAGPAAGRLECI